MKISDLVNDLIAEHDLNCAPTRLLAQAAVLKITPLFPDTPSGALARAVVEVAIHDVAGYVPGQRNSFHAVDAYKYLKQPDIPACTMAGVDSAYVRTVVSMTLGVEFDG